MKFEELMELLRTKYCDECPLYGGRLAKHKEPLCDTTAFPNKPECNETIHRHDEAVDEVSLYLKCVKGWTVIG